jgi:DNA-binding transcriptional ArsR family regulator
LEELRVAQSETENELQISSSLARLAMVYEYPLRMKIVTELYMREMSPKQFFEEFGGGSVSRVSRHFERLVEYGWLKLEGTATGGKRRGAVEHFYRATGLVVFDEEAWAELPVPMRAAFSWITVEQLTERVRAAIAAETFNARPDRRHLTWTPVLLDETGWDRVIAAVNDLFETILEEQKRSKLRIAESGEVPSLATVGLAAFESPLQITESDDWPTRPDLAVDARDPKESLDTTLFFPMQLAKVLADPEALQILAQLNLREMSPKQFHDEFDGGTMSSVGRRFQKLAKAGWLKMVREESGGRRRGATEHFYRAIGPAILDRDDWSALPDQLKATLTWKTFEQLREKAKEAIGAGTFDARTDRHLTWSLLLLDQLGWEEVIAAIDGLFQSIFLEKRNAESRISKSGEKPIKATVALAAFESPKDRTKAP